MPIEDDRLDLIKRAGLMPPDSLGPEEELVANGKIDVLPSLIRSKGLFLEYAHAPDIWV